MNPEKGKTARPIAQLSSILSFLFSPTFACRVPCLIRSRLLIEVCRLYRCLIVCATISASKPHSITNQNGDRSNEQRQCDRFKPTFSGLQ